MRKIIVLVLVFLSACRGASPPDDISVPTPEPTMESPTPSPDPTPLTLRFAVKGDWGAGTVAQGEVTRAMCALRETTPFQIVATTGDNFYPSGTARKDSYEDPEACLLAYPGHTWKASWGNHDAPGRSTQELLGTPSRYYSFREMEVTFFVLDSNRPNDTEQTTWFETGLQNAGSDVTVVLFHHPPFTTGSVHENNPAVQRNWVPLFERYGVDLVLTGHNHLYEHSVVHGIHYVVTGGGGASLYRCARQETWLVTCQSVHHFLIVEITGREIRVVAVDRQGAIIDEFGVTAS